MPSGRATAVLLLGVLATGCHDTTGGTPTPSGVTTTVPSAPTGGSNVPTSSPTGDCPTPPSGIASTSAPLRYQQALPIVGGYTLVFTGMEDYTDSRSRVTIEVRRVVGSCTDEASTGLHQGDSAVALGLHISVDRVIPSTNGIPPMLDISYRSG
ncbi:MAG: hypothetical protein ACR2FF_03325 [Mycobacteriales bacterium]|nr:MAG: hypothetical protein DLM56_03360 [Pseudonocardiales bacterium]